MRLGKKGLYAFNIKPLTKEDKSVLLSHPADCTNSPFAGAPLRTPAMAITAAVRLMIII